MEDSTKLVPNSELDVLWVKTTMEYEFPGANCQVLSVAELGEGAFGYMSAMRRISLQWDSNDKTLPKSLIVKVPNVSKASDAWGEGNSTGDQALQAIHMLHGLECRAYRLFRKEDDHELLVPRTYVVEDMSSRTPVILMDDLHPCMTVDFIHGFNEDQLNQIVDEIANYHIFSILHDGWEQEIGSDPEELSRMDHFPGMVRSIAATLPTQSPADFELLPEVNERILSGNWFLEYMTRFQVAGRLRTLTHGDLWSTQILWRDGKLVSVVDWQQSHPGSLTEDLQRVLYTCTPVDVRRRLTKALLERLFEKVKSALDRLAFEMPYTFPQLMKDYDESLPYTCGLTVFSAAMWANSEVIKGKNEEETAQRKAELFARTSACMHDTLTMLRSMSS